MKRSRNNVFFVCSVFVAVCICFTDVQADMSYDLTSKGAWDTDAFDGFEAYFVQIDPRATGTGLIDPFVRIKSNQDLTQGYNSSLRDPYPVPQFDEETNANWNHSLLLDDVPIVSLNENGVVGDYRQFMLDINEAGGKQSGISLDMIRIYQSDDPGKYNYNPSTGAWEAEVTADPVVLIYDLDAGGSNDVIELDYSLNSGSGSGDMYLYIPVGAFNSDDYVILYSHFGDPTGASDGFEEWAIDLGAPVIPVPGAVLLGILGLGAAGIKLRKFA